jgi:hypothetical protein
MRVLVCGGRNFADRALLHRVLDSLHDKTPINCVIHGAARGADTLADHWAQINGIPAYRFHAPWTKHGRGAGPIRNQRMIDKGNPDLVVGFPGAKGTKDMLWRARGACLKVIKVRPDGTMIVWNNDDLGGRCGDGDHSSQADTL